MQLHGTRQNDLLQIPSFRDKIRNGMYMGNRAYILGNDRTFIQFLGDIVAGRPDDLYPTAEGCMVGFGPGKGRKEGVMDINDAVGIFLDKLGPHDLHIAGQDDQVYMVLAE